MDTFLQLEKKVENIERRELREPWDVQLFKILNVYTSGAVKSDHKESRSVYNAELSSGRQVCWKNDLN